MAIAEERQRQRLHETANEWAEPVKPKFQSKKRSILVPMATTGAFEKDQQYFTQTINNKSNKKMGQDEGNRYQSGNFRPTNEDIEPGSLLAVSKPRRRFVNHSTIQ